MSGTNNLSLYWKLQLTGWSVASLYWVFVGYTGTQFSVWLAIIHFLTDLLIYIVPTHLFRLVSLRLKWDELSPAKLLLRIVPGVLLLGLSFMVLTIIKVHVIRLVFQSGYEETLESMFQDQGMITLVTGIRLMAIWVLAYYLYHYAQREIRATRETARLALITRETQLSQLSAQLNPHFFFNSLNSIKALVSEDPDTARRAIDLLSDLLRRSLYGKDTMISIEEEMGLVNDYLELEKLRFEERLKVTIQIAEDLKPVKVLPLSIQTLVENAIKHGIDKQKKGGEISISITRENARVRIGVMNTGTLSVGYEKGLGLKNLAERLQLQYNGKAVFGLNETEGNVLAILLIPQYG
jgi:LytS/YehU family sensor histidine kinase